MQQSRRHRHRHGCTEPDVQLRVAGADVVVDRAEQQRPPVELLLDGGHRFVADAEVDRADALHARQHPRRCPRPGGDDVCCGGLVHDVEVRLVGVARDELHGEQGRVTRILEEHARHPDALLVTEQPDDPCLAQHIAVLDRLQADGDDPANWTLATGDALSADELAELAFAWKACRAVKSNAILLAKDGASVGVGMGQVYRVDSCKLAVERAGAERARGS